MNTQQIIAIAIFAIVMVLIISEKIDRTVVALSGAALMFVFKILTFEEGISHIDFNKDRKSTRLNSSHRL